MGAVSTEAFSPYKNGLVIHHTAVIHVGQGFTRQPLFLFGIPAFHQSPSSFEQLSDIGHRPEQLHRLIRERQKALALIEATCIFAFGIDYNSERCDLASDATGQCIGQEIATMALPPISPINGEATKQRRWNERVVRKLADGLGGPLANIHGSCRQCIVASDGSVRQDKYKRRRNVLARVLSSLHSEVSIERLDAAFKRGPFVLRAKHLDAK